MKEQITHETSVKLFNLVLDIQGSARSEEIWLNFDKEKELSARKVNDKCWKELVELLHELENNK